MRSFSAIFDAAHGLLNALLDTFEPDRNFLNTALLDGIEGPWEQAPTQQSFHNCGEEYLLLLAVEIEISEV